ncbi:MAG: O-antigen ligase family protein [Draconibacterium sp.]|nr:O-antigen ligase family protein [Draconibacterium sp.]
MKYYLTKLLDSNWFFITLVGFVIVLPLSQALVSIFGGIVLFTSLVEDKWKNKWIRFKKKKILLFLPAIFLIYFISALISGIEGDSLYDLRKTLFFLVLPLAFIFGKEINNKQKRFVFYAFAFSIAVSIIVALIRWEFSGYTENLNVHKIGLISHIRFSFQLILIIWFIIFLIQKNYKSLKYPAILGLMLLTLYYLSFLFFQQSLIGIIALGASLVFYLFYLIFQIKRRFRIVLIIFSLAIISVPFIYVFSIVHSFYNIKSFDKSSIEKGTKLGHKYKHDFNNPMVENGNYVYLFVCEEEMRVEWNKISEFKYDSIGKNGYPVYSTLIRYLTSKGLKKDAEGILSLNKQDIRNVENGIANVIFQQNRYSLYPRIYQTVWEYYIYTHTGEANNQSFSQRIEFAKAAISIIHQNFWFGVGTGKWKDAFKNTYVNNGSKLDKNLYASSHNQYLNYMVKFGLVGFLLIMFFIIYPVVKTRKYTDPLFLSFLIFLFIANFGDSNFESHMGSSFFVFFYCLFLAYKNDDYMEIEKAGSSNS